MSTQSMESPLKTVQAEPFNAETPLNALETIPTPSPSFYVRSNFPVPELDAAAWRLSLGGHVRTPLLLSLNDLVTLPRHSRMTVLECAGNGRRLMRPVPDGTAWELGAVSTGRFEGVRLRDVLERAGVLDGAVEVVFRGADGGVADGRAMRFERSLPLERALHDDVLLAWSMNGEPLTPSHGFPLRLVVPGWYAVASVKWLVEMEVVTRPFAGHFQVERYVYREHPSFPDETPVTTMQVRSIITSPAEGAAVSGGCRIRGVAWSGAGDITRVEVSTDDGASWTDARLTPPRESGAMTTFELDWAPRGAGAHTLLARATDSAGNTQPLEPVWNTLGYANNITHRVNVSA